MFDSPRYRPSRCALRFYTGPPFLSRVAEPWLVGCRVSAESRWAIGRGVKVCELLQMNSNVVMQAGDSGGI
jgi:hypothetical protein